MPRLSVYMIRAALIHLGIGFTFGGLLLWNKGVPFEGNIWRLLAPHIELLLAGWMIQLAMGVAFWILPRFSGEGRYGNTRLIRTAFVLFNLGIVSAALGGWAGMSWLILGGRVTQLAAAASFALGIWPRVKPLTVASAHVRVEADALGGEARAGDVAGDRANFQLRQRPHDV